MNITATAAAWSLLALVALPMPASRPGQGGAAQPLYDVHAVRYATLRAFPVRALVAGADSSRRLDIAMMVWLLRAPGERTVLVDAGFYREKFLTQWSPAAFTRPDTALAVLGVAPGEVTDIIVTHVHWDHLDGVDLFPRARVWIQRDEYEHYIREDGTPRTGGIDSADAAVLASIRAAGRVELVEGDAREILPGITVYTGGRHTYASQYVRVRTAAGPVVIASDNLYLYENLDLGVPIAQTLDADANLAAQARMRHLAGDPRLIVPGHDPAVFTRFPRPGNGIAKIE